MHFEYFLVSDLRQSTLLAVLQEWHVSPLEYSESIKRRRQLKLICTSLTYYRILYILQALGLKVKLPELRTKKY